MNLKEMREKLASLVAKMKELNAAENFDAEEFNKARDEAVTLKAQIVDAENRATDLGDLEGFLESSPQPKAGKKVADTVPAQPKSNQPIFRDLGEQIAAVIEAAKPGGIVDERLRKVQNAASGMGESTPADGGFLVEQDKAKTILAGIYDGNTGLLASKVDRIPLSATSNGIKLPGTDESSRATGSRGGGVRCYWEGEGDTTDATKTKFRVVELSLKKLLAFCNLTDELIADTVALEAFVTKQFQAEMGFVLDDAIIRGNGAGKPLGILNAPCLVTVTKENGQAAATILADNVENMFARMPASMISGAEWFINQDCWPQIFQLAHAIGTGGVPLYRESLVGAPNGSLLGRPITPIEHASTVGSLGDIVFANLKAGYWMADKGGINQASSVHVRFLYDESVLRFTYRTDGQPKYASALTPYQGTNAISPFVALAARA